MSLLEVDGITVRFGGVSALDAVSFTVEDGELLGLIGPNGAGKTTMLKAITGVVSPERGRICLGDHDLTGLPPHRRIRLGLALSQQLVRPFRSLSVLDNVALAAGRARTGSAWSALRRLDRRAERARALDLLRLVGIADAAGAAPGNLPLGHLKRLELARALALEPELLLLDEPLAGLNQVEAAQLADIISELNHRGPTIILIEHNLGEVLRVCRRLVVLDQGRKLAEGAPRAVMADPAVRAAYLGAGGEDAAA
jgi:branched-chain amino acid transport system ATP-binding protein